MNVHVQVRTRARPAPATVRVERARALLDEHVTERVSLETLAEVAGVSKYHFIRLFNRVIGESPHAYQVRRRIDLARALLTQGLAASYVAQETGFSDHSHLIRTFRRFTGTTPTRFASGFASAFTPEPVEVRAAS